MRAFVGEQHDMWWIQNSKQNKKNKQYWPWVWVITVHTSERKKLSKSNTRKSFSDWLSVWLFDSLLSELTLNCSSKPEVFRCMWANGRASNRKYSHTHPHITYIIYLLITYKWVDSTHSTHISIVIWLVESRLNKLLELYNKLYFFIYVNTLLHNLLHYQHTSDLSDDC